MLKANGYPRHIINRNYSIVPKQPATSKIEPKATVIIPYIRHLSEGIRRILSKVNIRTCFKPHHTLREVLVHPKDPITPSLNIGVVYEIQCGSCNDTYVGQTGRTLSHRLKEHKKSLRSYLPFYTSSAVTELAIKTGHMIEWDRAKLLEICGKEHERVYWEAWNIRLHLYSMNRVVWCSWTLYRAEKGSGDMVVPNLFWKNAEMSMVTS